MIYLSQYSGEFIWSSKLIELMVRVMILLLIPMLTRIQISGQSYGKVNKCCDEGEIFFEERQECGQVMVGQYFLSRQAELWTRYGR